MNALILTGGQGTRLRPFTLSTPKPLLPIVNQPFLSYQISLLKKHGIAQAVLCMADRTEPYQSFIRSEKKRGVTIYCSREMKPLGTAGALKNAEKFLNAPFIFCFNGDVMTDINLTEMIHFHQAKKAMITVSLAHVKDPSPYGLALLNSDRRIQKFIEKPKLETLKKSKSYLINAGTYLFDRSIFNRIPPGENYSVENQLYPKCLNDNIPVYGYITAPSTYWLDIGTPQKYSQANFDVVQNKLSNFVSPHSIKKIGAQTKIHPTAKISFDTVIGKNCKIGARSQLNQCIVLDHVTLEDDVVLDQCIIGRYSKIAHHTVISELKCVGEHSVITSYSKL